MLFILSKATGLWVSRLFSVPDLLPNSVNFFGTIFENLFPNRIAQSHTKPISCLVPSIGILSLQNQTLPRISLRLRFFFASLELLHFLKQGINSKNDTVFISLQIKTGTFPRKKYPNFGLNSVVRSYSMLTCDAKVGQRLTLGLPVI